MGGIAIASGNAGIETLFLLRLWLSYQLKGRGLEMDWFFLDVWEDPGMNEGRGRFLTF